MATSRYEIENWFDAGRRKAKGFLLVVTDTYDWEDYPVYATSVEDVLQKFNHYHGQNMQRVTEVYDLALDKALQMAEGRAWHLPSL